MKKASFDSSNLAKTRRFVKVFVSVYVTVTSQVTVTYFKVRMSW
jgi:hypothetical protein